VVYWENLAIPSEMNWNTVIGIPSANCSSPIMRLDRLHHLSSSVQRSPAIVPPWRLLVQMTMAGFQGINRNRQCGRDPTHHGYLSPSSFIGNDNMIGEKHQPEFRKPFREVRLIGVA
jgi:hypothetical protein